jgi:hypothetical protein
MSEKTVTFRFRFNNKEGYHPVMRPGQIADIYGHHFIMQDNMDLVCTETVPVEERAAHMKMLQAEVAVGRFTMLRDEEVAKEDPLKGFTDTPDDFYGAGDADELKKRLMGLTPQSAIAKFARDRGITIPGDANTKTAKVNEIVDRVKAMVG